MSQRFPHLLDLTRILGLCVAIFVLERGTFEPICHLANLLSKRQPLHNIKRKLSSHYMLTLSNIFNVLNVQKICRYYISDRDKIKLGVLMTSEFSPRNFAE